MIFATGEQVSQVGIEPTTRGLKVPCSATELLAQALPDSTSKTQQYARPSPILDLRHCSNRDGNRKNDYEVGKRRG